MEHKAVPVNGFSVVDEEKGIVEALVSVTGLVDEVKDVDRARCLRQEPRELRRVSSHAWDKPISKTLDVKELMPGDPRLPKKTNKGGPWPTAAGALYIKTQSNLGTGRAGRGHIGGRRRELYVVGSRPVRWLRQTSAQAGWALKGAPGVAQVFSERFGPPEETVAAFTARSGVQIIDLAELAPDLLNRLVGAGQRRQQNPRCPEILVQLTPAEASCSN